MARKKDITPIIRKSMGKFIQALRTNGVPFSQVFLFGSHAQGKAREGSDLDICVVSDVFGKDYHADLVRLLKVSRELDMSVDVVPYHPKDFFNRYDPLAHEIRTYGIVIA